jgi:hypothetical protein
MRKSYKNIIHGTAVPCIYTVFSAHVSKSQRLSAPETKLLGHNGSFNTPDGDGRKCSSRFRRASAEEIQVCLTCMSKSLLC